MLAEVVKQVYSIELIESLGARRRRAWPSWATATSKCASATATPAGQAPFDGIVVTAAAPGVPPALVASSSPAPAW